MQAFHGLQTFSIYSTVKLPGMKVIDLETFLEMEKEAEASKDIR